MKWTIEKLQEEANKYVTRTDFYKNNSNAYMSAASRKLLNDLFKNHYNNGFDINRKQEGFWTFDKLQEQANKYKTRWEFGKKDNATYNIALRNNYMDKLFKNHTNNGYKKQNFTINKLQEEANKYKTRGKFQKQNRLAYNAAYSKKIIDKLFENHPNNGYDINIFKDNVYVIYVYELTLYNMAYVGLTNNIIRRDRDHLFNTKESLNNFCQNKQIPYPRYKILETNLNNNNVINREQYWIDYYKSKNWKMFNINKASSLGTISKKWSKKKLQEEANRYKTRGDFQKFNKSAHRSSRERNLLDDLFKNHINNGYVTYRKIRKDIILKKAKI